MKIWNEISAKSSVSERICQSSVLFHLWLENEFFENCEFDNLMMKILNEILSWTHYVNPWISRMRLKIDIISISIEAWIPSE